MMFYSPKNNSFYPFDMKDDYGDDWPSDAREVSDEDWKQFGQSTIPEGKVRLWQKDKLVWVDKISIKTKEQVEEEERVWRNAELFRSDIELNKVQDSDPKASGTVSVWRDYRKSLRAWPESTLFPEKSKRPIAPDSVN